MNKRVLKRILIVFLMLVFRQSWSEEVVDLPEVVVQESRLDSVLDGTLFEPIVGGVNFGGRHVSEYDMMNDQTYHAFLNSLSRAASVCGAKISSNSKAVTSESDVVSMARSPRSAELGYFSKYYEINNSSKKRRQCNDRKRQAYFVQCTVF